MLCCLYDEIKFKYRLEFARPQFYILHFNHWLLANYWKLFNNCSDLFNKDQSLMKKLHVECRTEYGCVRKVIEEWDHWRRDQFLQFNGINSIALGNCTRSSVGPLYYCSSLQDRAVLYSVSITGNRQLLISHVFQMTYTVGQKLSLFIVARTLPILPANFHIFWHTDYTLQQICNWMIYFCRPPNSVCATAPPCLTVWA